MCSAGRVTHSADIGAPAMRTPLQRCVARGTREHHYHCMERHYPRTSSQLLVSMAVIGMWRLRGAIVWGALGESKYCSTSCLGSGFQGFPPFAPGFYSICPSRTVPHLHNYTHRRSSLFPHAGHRNPVCVAGSPRIEHVVVGRLLFQPLNGVILLLK